MARINENHRGKIMAAIRSKDTMPELSLRHSLWQRGLTGYRCHLKRLPGCPDIAFTRCQLAIFVDGAFWHGHANYVRPNPSDYWKKKIARNVERDREAERRLQALGWTILRFWDFEVENDLERCVNEVVSCLRSRTWSRS